MLISKTHMSPQGHPGSHIRWTKIKLGDLSGGSHIKEMNSQELKVGEGTSIHDQLLTASGAGSHGVANCMEESLPLL